MVEEDGGGQGEDHGGGDLPGAGADSGDDEVADADADGDSDDEFDGSADQSDLASAEGDDGGHGGEEGLGVADDFVGEPEGDAGGDSSLEDEDFRVGEAFKAVESLECGEVRWGEHVHTLYQLGSGGFDRRPVCWCPMSAVLLAEQSTQILATPQFLDPMFWLGADSPFGSLILPGLGLIVFIETGLGFPLLPGDSLLFTAGMIASQPNGFAPVWAVLLVVVLCAIAGDQSSYWIGRMLGHKLRERPDGRIFKKAYIAEGEAFFEKWGPVAVILCRFVPIVRTYAPMTIGMAKMNYARFFMYDICGGLLWGGGVTLLGVWLGRFSFVQKNIEAIFLLIVFVSILPGIIGAIKKRRAGKREPITSAKAE